MGAIILSIGIASFITNFGVREFDIDDIYGAADNISPFTLRAPEGTAQSLTITAESFETILRTPKGDMHESHTTSVTLEWAHGPDGVSVLEITNTGPGELYVFGTVHSETDWVFITYNFFVMISGLIIIGFSAGFGKRRPRGF